MKSRLKIYLLFLMSIFVLNILTGCSSQSTKSDNESKKENGDTPVAAKDNIKTHLSIGSGCIGCNLCIRIDQEHFDFNKNSHIPKVISQTNLSSKNLQVAVNNCRVRAIIID